MTQYNNTMYTAQKMYDMCLKKNRYKTIEKAEKAARFMTEKYGKETRAYYCPVCNYYHLSTKPLDK